MKRDRSSDSPPPESEFLTPGQGGGFIDEENPEVSTESLQITTKDVEKAIVLWDELMPEYRGLLE